MCEPTNRQLEIFEFIKSFIGMFGMSPTHQEISDHFGFYVNASREHVNSMEKKGMLFRVKSTTGRRHVARNIRIAEGFSNESN